MHDEHLVEEQDVLATFGLNTGVLGLNFNQVRVGKCSGFVEGLVRGVTAKLGHGGSHLLAFR